jgi:hypothetical protein
LTLLAERDITYSQASKINLANQHGGEKVSDKDKSSFTALADATNLFMSEADEGMVLAITASYLAGKEAGKMEAEKAHNPG